MTLEENSNKPDKEDLKKSRTQKIDFLLLSLPALFIIGSFIVISPAYELEDWYIVKKISTIFYEKPIQLTFHWIVEDEIQVGKLMTLQITAENLPYDQNMTLNDIELYFEEKYINYWNDQKDPRQKFYPTSNIFLLKYNSEKNLFSSEKINFRFIVPVNMHMMLCDQNQNGSCEKIENIIQPAPYDLANRIDTNRLVLALTIVVIGVGLLNAWAILRK